LVEPGFADLKFNRKVDRFQRRGRSAASSEWRLLNATQNLLKLHRHQLAVLPRDVPNAADGWAVADR
jgi:hypothetical protein